MSLRVICPRCTFEFVVAEEVRMKSSKTMNPLMKRRSEMKTRRCAVWTLGAIGVAAVVTGYDTNILLAVVAAIVTIMGVDKANAITQERKEMSEVPRSEDLEEVS